MVKHGLLESHPGPHYTCYFVKGASRLRLPVAHALKSTGLQEVLAAIRQAPGCIGAYVARATGLDPSTVSRYAQRLCELGLVRARTESRRVRFVLTTQ